MNCWGFFVFFFLRGDVLRVLRDLSSPTRVQTRVPSSESHGVLSRTSRPSRPSQPLTALSDKLTCGEGLLPFFFFKAEMCLLGTLFPDRGARQGKKCL